MKDNKDLVYKLTEDQTFKEKEKNIKSATRKNSITLATSSFGRGTDFITLDDSVNANGGIHVLLTYLPEDLA